MCLVELVFESNLSVLEETREAFSLWANYLYLMKFFTQFEFLNK